MSRIIEPRPPLNQARRHFLGVVVAVSARVAGGIAAAAVLPLAATAQGRGPSSLGIGPPGNGNGGGRGPAPRGPKNASCFLRGTPIRTSSGEIAIEELSIGDLVATTGGKTLPVRWIGHQTFKKSGTDWPKSVLPIRITRHALDDRTPHTDLYLSPRHALFIDGLLIEARELVNGVSIVPAMPVGQDEIEYFNLVLDSHEPIQAAGAAAETCLIRDGNHELFTNFAEYERLYPAGLATMTPFAPLVGCEGGRAHLRALFRLSASRILRRTYPIQDLYENTCHKLAARAAECIA